MPQQRPTRASCDHEMWVRTKNDEKDAADLADLLRMGRLPQAWIAPAEIRELRELTRYRIKLVRARSSCKEQVHAVLAKLGIPVTCSGIFGVWGNTWLDGLSLPHPYAGKVASLRKLTGELLGFKGSSQHRLVGPSIGTRRAPRPGSSRRASCGGRPLRAAAIVAEIGDIRRFCRPARLSSWAGLTPRHRESDLKVTRGYITKQGSPLLRWAVVEAIQHRPPRRPGEEHRQDRSGPLPAHLCLLRDARRAGQVPGRPQPRGGGGVSRPGTGQRVIARRSGPRRWRRGRASD